MTRRRLLLILVPVLLVAGAAAFGLYYLATRNVAREQPAPQPAAQIGPATLRFPPGAPQLSFLRIQPVDAHPEPISEMLNGRIAYNENLTARVSSPIAGRVTKLLKQPGDTVKAGDALAEIDAPEYVAAQADVRRAEAEFAQKRAALHRVRTLFEGEVAPRRELELAQAELKLADTELTRARERLRILNLGQAGSGDRFVLRAPISGIVMERKANPGSEVRPDLPDPLFIVSDPEHLWLIIDLTERLLARVERGQTVLIEVDAYPAERYSERFTGIIEHIGEVLDPDTRRVPVRALVANPKRMLRPEMFARVTPLVTHGREMVRIPNSALTTEGLYSFVFVEKEPGVLEQRPVTLSIRGRDDSYVAEGLKPGDRVVTTGALLLASELVSGE